MRTHHLIVIACCILPLTSCSVYSTKTFLEYDAGVKQAARHLARGKIVRLDNTGIIRSGYMDMRKTLRKRYKIEYKYDPSVSYDYMAGYNTIMRSAAVERFGENYYKKALRDVVPDGVDALGILDQ